MPPINPGSGDLQTLIQTLQNVVIQLGNLTKTIQSSTSAIFPQIAGTASTASAGTGAAPPATVQGYINVTLPDGSSAKVPYFKP